jgi:inorganic pyrophosphatase/exopolyphosphatase
MEGSEPVIRLVTGNEASDADSIVCSLVGAYLLDKGLGITMPLIMCDRKDMCLRGETVLLLEQCGVDPSKLLFGDDPEIVELLKKSILIKEVILVDHNKATGIIEPLGEKVTAIFDHHLDLEAHAHVIGTSRAIAFEGAKALAASCGTVLAEQHRGALQHDAQAARALFGVILIDSVNMDEKAKKGTQRDADAIEFLMSAFGGSQEQRQTMFSQLDGAKFDAALWRKLEVDQCLRYDYKCFTVKSEGKPDLQVGISSVLCALDDLSKKERWNETLLERIEKENLNLFAITAQVKTESGTKRQLMLLASDEDSTKSAGTFVKEYREPDLELTDLEPSLQGPSGILAFNQGNLGASRKQVAPCLQKYLASLA